MPTLILRLAINIRLIYCQKLGEVGRE